MEVWCNRVAAELLVPLAELRSELAADEPIDAVPALTRAFKVSTLVILRRLLDAGAISRDRFDRAYAAKVSKLSARPHSRGGDFYQAQGEASRRFARAIIASTLEGRDALP